MAAFDAEALVGGRGAVVQGTAAVEAAIAQSRHFSTSCGEPSVTVHAEQRHPRGRRSGARTRRSKPDFGGWPIFEHCLPFNVQRYWDELDGIDWPRIWTADRDREVWAALQGQ